ncbi:YSC84-related protein [Novosphingobium malaysiense]|uniref:YSC84-related protein n=1 Tax=Novosphingobium malaysiense TaxID=1348853 RepID=UPI00068F6F66|nr:YSC84-related protein [Novosphingobium malaysiense]
MQRFRAPLIVGSLALALAACQQEPASQPSDEAATADAAQNPVAADLDGKVMAALDQCKQVEPSCGTGTPAAYLVFPDVTSIALGVGGSGGDGALVKDGKIVSYWRMGEGSVGLQAGIEAASYVFKINNPETLDQYQNEGEWTIGAESGITVVNADANAQADSEDSVAYVFNASGLMADASIDAMKIWRTNEIADGGNASTDMTSTDTDNSM